MESLSGADPNHIKAKTPDSVSAKKTWCVDHMMPNFFAVADTKDAKSKTPLEQFNNFVNVICPALDLNIPSKLAILGANCTAL